MLFQIGMNKENSTFQKFYEQPAVSGALSNDVSLSQFFFRQLLHWIQNNMLSTFEMNQNIWYSNNRQKISNVWIYILHSNHFPWKKIVINRLHFCIYVEQLKIFPEESHISSLVLNIFICSLLCLLLSFWNYR